MKFIKTHIVITVATFFVFLTSTQQSLADGWSGVTKIAAINHVTNGIQFKLSNGNFAGCSNNGIWYLEKTDPDFQSKYSLILALHLAGKDVFIYGTCSGAITLPAQISTPYGI